MQAVAIASPYAYADQQGARQRRNETKTRKRREKSPMAEKKVDERRRYLRYPPDPTEIVMVQFSSSSDRFTPEIAALPSEESRGGLRLILLNRDPVSSIEVGSACTVKVANLGPQQAEVRWIDAEDQEVVRLGIQFTGD